MKTQLKYQTQHEINRLLKAGMNKLSASQFNEMIHEVGYKINPPNCFYYINTSNEFVYSAKALDYTHINSGIGYAHINAPSDSLPKLQNIRRNYFVVNNGRIWEL